MKKIVTFIFLAACGSAPQAPTHNNTAASAATKVAAATSATALAAAAADNLAMAMNTSGVAIIADCPGNPAGAAPSIGWIYYGNDDATQTIATCGTPFGTPIAAAIDDAGDAIVAYVDGNNDLVVMQRAATDTAFSAPTVFEPNAMYNNGSLRVGYRESTPFVVWRPAYSPFWNPPNQITHYRRVGDPESATVDFNTPNALNWPAGITVDGNGHIILALNVDAGANTDGSDLTETWVAESDDGITFSPSQRLDNVAANWSADGDAWLATNNAGQAVLAWTAGPDGEDDSFLQTTMRSADGTWSPAEQVRQIEFSGLTQALMLDDGTALVTTGYYTGTNWVAGYMTNSGNGWSATTEISEYAEKTDSLAALGNGQVAVGWSNADYSSGSAVYSPQYAIWGENTGIGATELIQNADWIDLISNGAGNLSAVYEANNELYFSSLAQ